MKKLVAFTFALVALMASSANADLILNISGLPGSGVTTWEFVSSSGVTSGDRSIRDNTGSTYNDGDTTQFGTFDGIANAGYQDLVFALTGNASITVGNSTELITGIFLDDDGTTEGDDLGIRVANQIDYLTGEAVSWSGSGTVNVDINDFFLGTFIMDFGNLWELDQGNTVVNISAIPEPTGIAMIGFAAVGLIGIRRRK